MLLSLMTYDPDTKYQWSTSIVSRIRFWFLTAKPSPMVLESCLPVLGSGAFH